MAERWLKVHSRNQKFLGKDSGGKDMSSSRQLKIACNSAVYEEVGFRWRNATVVSSTTETAKPTLFLDLEPSVK